MSVPFYIAKEIAKEGNNLSLFNYYREKRQILLKKIKNGGSIEQVQAIKHYAEMEERYKERVRQEAQDPDVIFEYLQRRINDDNSNR